MVFLKNLCITQGSFGALASPLISKTSRLTTYHTQCAALKDNQKYDFGDSN